jgi:hypothetical protein
MESPEYRKKTNDYVTGRQKERKLFDAEYKRKTLESSKASHVKYKDNYRKSKLAYVKNKLNTDPNWKLRALLRHRLYIALHGNHKSGSAVRDLGCSVEFLKNYLESKFQPEMTWDNWSPKGWHIDHIKPLSLFDLTDREQLLKACHYTNLQPLWAKDNLIKGTKVA